MSRAKQRTAKGLLLPWEGGSHWLRDAFSGRRPRLLVGLAVAVLAIVLLSRSADRQARARRTWLAIEATERASQAFRQRYGRCPQSVRELRRPAALGAPLLSTEPVDGWGRPLWLLCPSPDDAARSRAVSAGADGSFFTEDNLG